MPLVKTRRDDILRKSEIDDMLRKCDTIYLGDRLKCIIALLWIFGKRIHEVLKLKRSDAWADEDFLYVRFQVGKKKGRKDLPVPKPYLKKIRLEHPYVQHILNWLKQHPEGYEGYIFPSYGEETVRQVTSTFRAKNGEQVTRSYEYKVEGGHITRSRVHQLIKEINPKAWSHLFRESLATYMAEHGATEEELMHYFDWDDIRTAHDYVKRGTKLTEKWSERAW